MERIWNQTQHIITTHPEYKTENGNFNMIFNDNISIKEFIKYFYYIMPIIHTYVVRLTLKILYDIGRINELEYLVNDSIIRNRYMLLVNDEEKEREENKEIQLILNKTYLLCPHCFNEINNEKGNKELLRMWHLYCPFCKKIINLDRFIFYNCHKEGDEYIRGRYKSNKKG